MCHTNQAKLIEGILTLIVQKIFARGKVQKLHNFSMYEKENKAKGKGTPKNQKYN